MGMDRAGFNFSCSRVLACNLRRSFCASRCALFRLVCDIHLHSPVCAGLWPLASESLADLRGESVYGLDAHRMGSGFGVIPDADGRAR